MLNLIKIKHGAVVGYNYEVCQVNYIKNKLVNITNGKKQKTVFISDIKPIIITIEWLLFLGFKKKDNILEYILPKEWFRYFFSEKYVYNNYIAKVNKNNKVVVYHSYLDKPNAIYLNDLQYIYKDVFSKLDLYHIHYFI